MLDPIELTRALVAFDTINPPGREHRCAEYVASRLADAGLDVRRDAFDHDRMNVVARLPGSGDEPPLVLTGHLDTVPLGAKPWSFDPFAGEIADGKLYGRGTSDMKSGVAAIVSAVCALAAQPRPRRGITVVLTSGEETGCIGAQRLATLPGALGQASAVLVAEPTGNRPAIGHKGALFLRARTSGVTAHSSMPEKGVNAIYKAARAITTLEGLELGDEADPLLGHATLNVGMVSGGLNVNSVPDSAEFTVDVRSTTRQSHAAVMQHLRTCLGPDVDIEAFLDLPALATGRDDPFIRCVFGVVGRVLGAPPEAASVPFFTDAAVLHQVYAAPTVILGPGETAMAHQTDEYCRIDRIPEAVEIFREVARDWCGF